MYNQKAFEILDSSIHSAIFIDEKAKNFFSETPINNQIPEEKLSVSLFNTFRDNGKSLAVHKFDVSNLSSPKILDYLFKGRDLILLDWELADMAGQEHSLNLLNRAVNTPYINFCCIYSSSTNFNQIPLFLDTYFSGLSKAEYTLIKDSYSNLEAEEIQKIWEKGEEEIKTFFEENSIDMTTFPIELLRNKSQQLILRYIYISLNSEKYFIPDQPVEYEVLHTNNNSFIINNTFILTLKKDIATDVDYNSLLQRISEIIVENKGSFFQLLGLEMQSVFNSNERFIDETILKSSTEALFQFRNHLNDDKAFGIIIKKLLLEQATLKLRTAKLKLLDSEFLGKKSEEIKDTVTNNDLLQLNVFYNSVTVKSLYPDDIPNLNFGDVFKDKENNYYLCITALCDCYYPNKIESNFYFAKGKEFTDLETALRLGDTAFLSFLPNSKVVQWGDTESIKKEKIKKNEGESEEHFKCRKLEIELNAYKSFIHKPFYIKPKVFNVENHKLIGNIIRIWEITNKVTERPNQNLNYFDVEYVTTLRNDYTQRIANHAFGHPARVGVDFAKKR